MGGKHSRALFRKVHRQGVQALTDDELAEWLEDRRSRRQSERGELEKLVTKDAYAAQRELDRRADAS